MDKLKTACNKLSKTYKDMPDTYKKCVQCGLIGLCTGIVVGLIIKR